MLDRMPVSMSSMPAQNEDERRRQFSARHKKSPAGTCGAKDRVLSRAPVETPAPRNYPAQRVAASSHDALD